MKHLTYLLFISIFTLACGGNQAYETETNEVTSESGDEYALEKNGIRLVPVKDSPSYENAHLHISSPSNDEHVASGEVAFSFIVENYELGKQTADAEQKHCANSVKGQHIHLILNNEPYTAHYEPEFSQELADGHYDVLAFLSRSYHESLKTAGAFLIDHFTVNKMEGECNFDPTLPHMFYSRPKGTYTGEAEISKLMLDFYLANVDLSLNGYQVRATINGTEFRLTEWVPYMIEGLGSGEVSVKLELLDKSGELVNSPFNPVERSVSLVADKTEG